MATRGIEYKARQQYRRKDNQPHPTSRKNNKPTTTSRWLIKQQKK